jgi:hypothetical protein
METTVETGVVTNEQYSFETSISKVNDQPDHEDVLIFEDANPAKLFISDIIY